MLGRLVAEVLPLDQLVIDRYFDSLRPRFCAIMGTDAGVGVV